MKRNCARDEMKRAVTRRLKRKRLRIDRAQVQGFPKDGTKEKNETKEVNDRNLE